MDIKIAFTDKEITSWPGILLDEKDAGCGFDDSHPIWQPAHPELIAGYETPGMVHRTLIKHKHFHCANSNLNS